MNPTFAGIRHGRDYDEEAAPNYPPRMNELVDMSRDQAPLAIIPGLNRQYDQLSYRVPWWFEMSVINRFPYLAPTEFTGRIPIIRSLTPDSVYRLRHPTFEQARLAAMMAQAAMYMPEIIKRLLPDKVHHERNIDYIKRDIRNMHAELPDAPDLFTRDVLLDHLLHEGLRLADALQQEYRNHQTIRFIDDQWRAGDDVGDFFYLGRG